MTLTEDNVIQLILKSPLLLYTLFCALLSNISKSRYHCLDRQKGITILYHP